MRDRLTQVMPVLVLVCLLVIIRTKIYSEFLTGTSRSRTPTTHLLVQDFNGKNLSQMLLLRTINSVKGRLSEVHDTGYRGIS